MARTRTRKHKSPTAIVPAKPEPQQIDYLRREASLAPSIEKTAGQLAEIRRFIRRNLKSDSDYGKIPGVDHKFLLQPGAEKIAMWLKVKPVFETLEHELSSGHLEAVVRCRLVSFVAMAQADPAAAERTFTLSEATASCSTMETNFRYRWCRMEDKDGRAFIPDRAETAQKKAIGMGRFLAAKMVNGKLIPYTKDELRQKPQIQYWLWEERLENPNIHDERNKVRQMAEKRAFVKGIRRMGALSNIFKEDPMEWPGESGSASEPPPEKFKPGQLEREPAPQSASQAAQSSQPPGADRPKKIVFVSWQRDRQTAWVSGYLVEVRERLGRDFLGVWLEGQKVFIVPAPQVPQFIEYCLSLKHEVQETQPPKEAKPHWEAPGAAEEEKGTIARVRESKGGKSLQVLFSGVWLSCFDKALWPHLYKGQGQSARLLVLRREGKPPVIAGLLQVGKTSFDSDGRTPFTDVNTPTDNKSLFN